MRSIFKYPLGRDIKTEFSLELPIEHKILCIKNQNESCVLYALVDPNTPIINAKFQICLTGQELDDMWLREYIDTVMFGDGKLVLHFYKDNR